MRGADLKVLGLFFFFFKGFILLLGQRLIDFLF